jgi:RHS repeat-associated protein
VPFLSLLPNGDKRYRIQDNLGSTRVVLTADGSTYDWNEYEPFGTILRSGGGQYSSDRLSYIGKEKDSESDLGDFGVRKYEAETGRFLSTDPLWEKYRTLTPYHYCGNNPINAVDPNGKVIIPKNLTNEQKAQLAATLQELRSWNSPTVNTILDAAEGKESKIFLHFLSGDRESITTNTPSNIGRKNSIEAEWNNNFTANGLTLRGASKNSADVIIESEIMGTIHLENSTSIAPFTMAPLILLDELNHAVSKESSPKKQEIDHSNLNKSLQKEIDSGTLKVNDVIRQDIQNKSQDTEKSQNNKK